MKPLRSSAPAHSLLNPAFEYRNSASSDIRLTFERVRREEENKAVKLAVWKIERKAKP